MAKFSHFLRRALPDARPLSLLCACLLSLLGGLVPASGARAQLAGIDEYAAAIASGMTRYRGPTQPWPDPGARPEGGIRSLYLDSERLPLRVHAEEGVAQEEAERALAALELSLEVLEREGWPLPFPDHGGGSPAFDLYLVRGAPPLGEADPGLAGADPITLGYDAPIGWGLLDGVTAFATLDLAQIAASELEVASTVAYVRALLLSQDPAEARAWRRATAVWQGWRLWGRFFEQEALIEQQRHPERGWIHHEEGSGPGGALFVGMLSERADGGSGAFLRDLWQAARQKSYDTPELRGTPDMWEVATGVMEVGGDPLPDLIQEMAVSRYFSGPQRRSSRSPYEILRDLPVEAEVPFAGGTSWERLPRRIEPLELELEPHGSAYVLVDTTEAPAGARLRVWMRGEPEVMWSLVAVRLVADRRELGRLRAPLRDRERRAYLPVELFEGTEKVLLVITNLSRRTVDADEPDDNVRAFRLSLAAAAEGD